MTRFRGVLKPRSLVRLRVEKVEFLRLGSRPVGQAQRVQEEQTRRPQGTREWGLLESLRAWRQLVMVARLFEEPEVLAQLCHEDQGREGQDLCSLWQQRRIGWIQSSAPADGWPRVPPRAV